MQPYSLKACQALNTQVYRVCIEVKCWCRQGDLSAEALQADFARALRGSPAAPALFADLAALLPPGPQRAGLRAAAASAGWSPSPHVDPSMSPARAASRGRPYATDAGGERSDQGAALAAETSDPTGSGWVPLDRSRIGVLANELAGGPSGGPGVAAAAANAARLSASPEQGLSGQAAPAAPRGAAVGDAGADPGTPGEQEAAALRAAGLDTRGAPARPAKRLRRGRGAAQADAGPVVRGAADPGRASGAGAAPPAGRNVLLWLRQDLRLHDNPALAAAARDAARMGGTVAFMFISSPEEDGDDLHTGACISHAGHSTCKEAYFESQKH